MGQRSDEIKKHIDEQRSELTENLEKLEERVKSTTDWRVQFDKRPMLMLGVAFGGGLLLGGLVPTRRRRHDISTSTSTSSGSAYTSQSPAMAATGAGAYPQASTSAPRKRSATSRELRKTWSMMDDIRATLIGVGATKLRDYLSGLVPGFGEHYQKREEERRRMGELGEESMSQTGSHAGQRRTGETVGYAADI